MKMDLMRTITTLLLSTLLLAGGVPALAEEDPQHAQALRSAHTLEVTGGVLTGVGVATEIATLALWSTWHLCIDSCSRTPDEQRADDRQYAASVATAVIAPVFLIAGITTWAIGANRRKTLQRRTASKPTLTFTGSGGIGEL